MPGRGWGYSTYACSKVCATAIGGGLRKQGRKNRADKPSHFRCNAAIA